MTGKKSAKGSFEESLKRLEKIVESLEQGKVTLDEAVDLYEEGIRLSKLCSEKLKSAELRIKKLTKDMNGQFQLLDVE
ncbi:MAG: exodeoxyribonuclease VII small subunit [Ignavibacteriales bacterium]|nr:exodeoxyribonuclease VII small subunit [Ignavibacteriales bacterium]